MENLKKAAPKEEKVTKEPWEKGWTERHDPAASMATIPGEPLEVFRDGKASLIETEDGQYVIQRDDGTYALNRKTNSAAFDSVDEAKKAYFGQGKVKAPEPLPAPEKVIPAKAEPINLRAEPKGDSGDWHVFLGDRFIETVPADNAQEALQSVTLDSPFGRKVVADGIKEGKVYAPEVIEQVKAKPTQPPAPAKEPWEMTASEHRAVLDDIVKSGEQRANEVPK